MSFYSRDDEATVVRPDLGTNTVRKLYDLSGGGVLLLFSDALRLCPFGVGAQR